MSQLPDSKELSYQDFKLPARLVSKTDVARLVFEAERVDNELTSKDAHSRVQIEHQIDGAMSPSLADFLELNQLNIDDSASRTKIIRELRLLKNKVPIIHLTFGAEADHDSLVQMSGYLRQEVHPQAVIAAGLQPSLVAGVHIRTTNRVFDRSIRAKLRDNRHFLIEELEALSHVR